MRSSLIYIPFFILVLISCNKDKVSTTPSLKIKSVSASMIPVGGSLIVDLSFTDKEGDISDTLYMKKTRVNQRMVPTVRDTLSLQVPDYPGNSKGVLEINLDYNNYLISAQSPPTDPESPTGFESDSLIIQFALKDKAGHISDTASTGLIVVQR